MWPTWGTDAWGNGAKSLGRIGHRAVPGIEPCGQTWAKAAHALRQFLRQQPRRAQPPHEVEREATIQPGRVPHVQAASRAPPI